MMLTIILSSSVLYEMAGPVSAKAALLLSGSIPYGKKENQEAGVETSGDMAEEPAERSAAGTAGETGEETPADMAEEPPEESAVAIEGEDTERVRTSGTETDAASGEILPQKPDKADGGGRQERRHPIQRRGSPQTAKGRIPKRQRAPKKKERKKHPGTGKEKNPARKQSIGKNPAAGERQKRTRPKSGKK